MTQELKEILTANELQDCISLFEEHKILDVEIASELTDSDLIEIGLALGERKKIIKLFRINNDNHVQPNNEKGKDNPQEIFIHHAAASGEDVSTGFGKGFGETSGKIAGGCAWFIGIIIVIIIIFMILISL